MTFGILGPLDVRDTADRQLAIRRRKARTLLALMLCHRDRDVPAHRLTDWLWGSEPPVSALANLHSYVSDLRRVLAGTAAAGSLHTTGDGYLLQVRAGQLDADRFEDLAEAGARALRDGDASVAAEYLGQAAGLWRGEVLPDLALPATARSPVARLAERRLEVLTGHAQARLALGRHQEAAIELALLTRRFPRHEPLWRMLMLSYAYGGRPGDAQLTYDCLCTTLKAHGEQPSPETVALGERIRRDDVPTVRHSERQRTGRLPVNCRRPPSSSSVVTPNSRRSIWPRSVPSS
jgi:DNA-binding SARP family transcriptional activator